MNKPIFLAILLLLTGNVWAQDLPAETVLYESQNASASSIDHSEALELLLVDSLLKTKDPVIAWLISFPAGMLGLHRAYLGTSGKTVFLYVITAGGFLGIVPMIDWILLLKGIQDGDISNYENNRRFIMWRTPSRSQ